LATILIATWFLFSSPLVQNGPIQIGQTEIINDYPETVSFEVDAESSAGTIDSVEFNLAIRGDTSTSMEPAEFEPGPTVAARYVWKTLRDSIPPGTPIRYSWTVRDDAGNKVTTEPVDYTVVDSRFSWKMLENDDIALWWYDGDAEFGEGIFDSAVRALANMEKNTGQSLPDRIHVVLYGNDRDFDSWHNYAREWVGGEAFSAMGLTVQIVPPVNSQRIERWINQVIPHEIAHLFFYQITDTPFSAGAPTWLNEGFAQYHELGSKTDELAWVQGSAELGELIPLRLLTGSFTGDDDQISLSYAESLSAVTFLLERWGDAGMGTLLSAYKAGRDTDQALLEATGLDFDGFEQAWWEWLGGQPGAYPTRPARAAVPTMPAFTTPTLRATPVPTKQAAAVEEPPVVAVAEEPTVAATATPVPTEAPTTSPVASPAPTAVATAAAQTETRPLSGLPCAGALGFLGAGMAVAVLWRKSGPAR
jgi:hypothetical protein